MKVSDVECVQARLVLSGTKTVAWVSSVRMLGTSGKHLGSVIGPAGVSILWAYATTVRSSVSSWCMMTPEYGLSHIAKVFRCVFRSLICCVVSVTDRRPSVARECCPRGAGDVAISPSWSHTCSSVIRVVSARETGCHNVGGLIEAVLSSAHGPRKFLTLFIALFIPSARTSTMYTFAPSLWTGYAFPRASSDMT